MTPEIIKRLIDNNRVFSSQPDQIIAEQLLDTVIMKVNKIGDWWIASELIHQINLELELNLEVKAYKLDTAPANVLLEVHSFIRSNLKHLYIS